MRKELTLTIDADGRDQGKQFHIREMSARQAEKWATRALLAIMHAGAVIPDGVAGQGLAGLATMGLPALTALNFRELEPLLDEMLDCVTFIPDPGRPMVRRKVADDDIDEVATLLRLREEIISLHLGFSIRALASNSIPSSETVAHTPATPTSRRRLAR